MLEDFRDAGLDIAYATNVVADDLYVASEPDPGEPLDIVRQILVPHRLVLRSDAGVWFIVPEEAPAAVRPEAGADTGAAAEAQLENVIVAASRYEISRDFSTSQFSLDRRSIQTMPDIGEDPIRVTQRLPGTAASGASARAHFRGGEESEIGIMLNGNWLFDPFHIRDYQNVFSAIDARAIQGVEVYTGGFPVRFGDRMSGLVLMDSLEPENDTHNEIGLSVYNTSLLTAGSRGDTSWLFSARRGNLDLVIDPMFGQPSYFDVFGELAWELSPAARLSVNALYADDSVELVLETDPAEREFVTSDTRNAQVWLQLASEWSDSLASSTVLSFVDYSNVRVGVADDEEKMIASVRDLRDTRQIGLQQDWIWSPSDRHRTAWGLHVVYGEADFAYDANAEYFELQASYVDRPDELVRSLTASPGGASYALYVSDRWKLSDKAILEWGLRWDDQTYTKLGSDSQLSPRLSLMYRMSENSELRISAGRYHQSQAIQSLQIEDGVTTYHPAQRADHLIAGFHYRTANDTSLRIEGFYKDVGKVRPRYENLYDPLGIMPELQPDRVRVAPTSARAQGVEVSADRTEGPWTWWASYTFSEVSDRVDGHDQPRSWDQRHALQAGFAWRNEKWDFSAATSVHSGWPTTSLSLAEVGIDDEGEPLYEATPGPRNAERLPSFASVDVRLSRRFDLSRGSLLAFVEVSNVLDRSNVCCLDWDIDDNGELERGVDHWMPLLPAIGVLWEF
ncbi:MAG: TonB-dependent receptor [Gammaproteobacteria bacterium]|nr:TonB-dependent receptor [Gammaproteobacteria bacterium]NNF49476.1 TonB-dependent receptor [Woeseiaceae bacterium]MBT8093868.1 TonB-dependent receptor [Gammaproteobacteria bacterium]MBT8105941.1 TonB-dependent receptor [Gammaproteobacteria bacterium]NNK25955.1 TonB-dependent receptor [Woeseiaceae bacterium]